MKNDNAYGGIVIRKRKKTWEVLLIKDKAGIWTFPKGHKENNETDIETAVREINEETGINRLKHIADLGNVYYSFNSSKEIISKTVGFYLFITRNTNEPYPAKEEGITQVQWICEKEIYNKLGYPKTNWPLFEKAIVLIRTTK